MTDAKDQDVQHRKSHDVHIVNDPVNEVIVQEKDLHGIMKAVQVTVTEDHEAVIVLHPVPVQLVIMTTIMTGNNHMA